MQLTDNEFVQKWSVRFQPNDEFAISAGDLQELTQDVADSFGDQAGNPLNELALPQQVLGASWYVLDSGIWAARRDFFASAAPFNGPNWRLVAGFQAQRTNLNAADILDASEAGRAMLRAPTKAAQRALVSNLNIATDQYGVGHPGWSDEDGPTGLHKWVVENILALLKKPAVQVPLRPLAPTNGQVNDRDDLLSFIATPGYLLNTHYRVVGLPGSTGVVAFDTTNSYVENGRIYLKVVGPVPKGQLAVYVGGSGNIPDGLPLFSGADFTGPAPSDEGILNFSVQGDDTIINFAVTSI